MVECTKQLTHCNTPTVQKTSHSIIEQIKSVPTNQAIGMDGLANAEQVRNCFFGKRNLRMAKYRKRRNRITKTVHFHDTCKIYDGLSTNSRMLENVIIEYFRYPKKSKLKTAIVKELFYSRMKETLIQLFKDIGELVQRLETHGSTPILIRGGGRAFQLFGRRHLRRMQQLQKQVEYAVKNCVDDLRNPVEQASENNGTAPISNQLTSLD